MWRTKNRFQTRILFMLMALGVSVAAYALEVKTRDEDFDGDPDVVSVETKLYRVLFDLRANGRVESLIFKPSGDELNKGRYFGRYYRLGNDYPLLNDPETGVRATRELTKPMTDRRMTCTVERADPNAVKLIFEAPGPDLFEVPWMCEIWTRRIVTLRDDSLVIEFNQEVTNQSDKPRPIFMHMEHGIFINREESQGFAPHPEGVRSINDSPKISGSNWRPLTDPQANWWGALKHNGVGGVITFDGTSVQGGHIHVHSHHEPGGMGFPLDHRPRILKPGQTESYPYTFMAVSGLKSLSGAVPGLVAGLAFGENPAPCKWLPDLAALKSGEPLKCELSLFSDVERELRIEVRVLDALANKEIHKSEHLLKTPRHRVATVSFTIPAVVQGINAIFVSAREGEHELLSFHQSLDVGQTGKRWAYQRDLKPWKGDEVTFKETAPAAPRKRPDIDFSIVTEHIPWSRPHASGQRKVFFCVPYDYIEIHLREIVQRGDFLPTVVRLDELKDLPQQSKGQDILFLGGHAIAGEGAGPAALRKSIMNQAAAGQGVVVMAPSRHQTKELLSTELLAMLSKDGKEVKPEFYDTPHRIAAVGRWNVRFFEVGRGRVAVVDAAVEGFRDSLQGFFSASDWYVLRDTKGKPIYQVEPRNGLWRGYEYVYAFLVRIMDWAGGRPTYFLFRDAQLKEGADGTIIELPIENISGAPLAGVAEFTLRSVHNETLAAASIPFTAKNGGEMLRFPVGSLPAGVHALEFRLLDAQRLVLAFGSQAVTSLQKARLVLKFDHEAEAYRLGETPRVEVKATDLPLEGDYALAYDVVDTFGRVVAKSQMPFNPQNGVSFSLDPWEAKSVLHDLRVSVLAKGQVLVREIATFYLFPRENPLKNNFLIQVWGPIETHNVGQRQFAARSARLAGVDISHAHGDGRGSRDLVYRTNGYIYSPAGSSAFSFRNFQRDKKSGILTPSFVPTPEENQKIKPAWQDHVRKANHVSGIFFFCLDDERQLPEEFDQSPVTLTAYREWLKEKYQTLDRLNSIWNTNYGDWGEIAPKFDVVRYGPEANIAPYLQWREFMDWAWAEFYMRRPGVWAQEVVPAATVGEAGIYQFPGNPTRSLGLFYNHTNYYPDQMKEEIIRCLAPKGFEAGPYVGYDMDFDLTSIAPSQRAFPWRVLFHGGHHIAYWEMQTSKRFNFGVLQRDGRPSFAFRVLVEEEWPDLKGCVARLVMDRHFMESGVAFAFSRRNELLGESRFGVEKTIVEDLHFQHHVYDLETQIAVGALQQDAIKLLFLPPMRCMSEAERKSIQSFVEAGGHLLMMAHRTMGEMDEHGRLHRDAEFFSRLSGVDLRSGRHIAGKGEAKTRGDLPELVIGVVRPAWRGLKPLSAEVRATTTIRGEEIVIWTRQRQGKGMVHVLNIDLGDYLRSQVGGVAGELRTTTEGPAQLVRAAQMIFRQILTESGAKPILDITRGGEPLCSGESFRFEDGTGPIIFATLPRSIAPGKAQITLPSSMHLYDVRDRLYLGKTATFEDDLRPGRAEVWAALPYKVSSIKLTATKKKAGVFKPGERLSVEILIQAEGGHRLGAHTFRIELQRRVGDTWLSQPAHAREMTAPGGACSAEFPLALNEAPGEYRVLARDIMTNTTGELLFRVAGGE